MIDAEDATAIIQEICERIADGESLRTICDSQHIPTTTTIKRWLQQNETFRAQYTQAREDQADHYADVIVEIADTEPDPAMARVRIDARKWVASKLLPKKYGDRQQLDVSGQLDVRGWLQKLGEPE